MLFCVFAIAAKAQIKGVVVDEQTGDSIGYVSVSYKGHHLSVVGDPYGNFTIPRHDGWLLTFSAVGYKSKEIRLTSSSKSRMVVKLRSESKMLDEVKIKSKKSKYSRKENPAVELMRRVINAKQRTKLENKDFYEYRNYERLTFSLNDISDASLDSGVYSRKPWLKKQVEKHPVTGKNILPVIVNEKISRKMYRRAPQKTRIYVDAENSYGVNDLIESGDVFTKMANDVFTEVDIYDDQVRLLQFPFTSPISKDGIGFYRYYIADTLAVGKDSCIQVSFLPNNQQDFGFRGDIWVIKDSTLQVKKVHLSIPKRSDVNFVTDMSIDQEYLRLPSGEWVLNVNDMLVEMAIVGNTGTFLVQRTSRRNDYSFEPIDEKLLKGKTLEVRDPYSQMRSKDYWTDNREVTLSKGEAGMDDFIKGIKSTKGFGWLMVGLKAVMENYIETAPSGKKSYVDIGPISSMISSNDIDGFRFRLSAQTTAYLNPHIFFKGYWAHGFRSHNDYLNATLTYSFNKKAYSPDEFPMRNIILSTSKDICSPSDKFLDVDKDNVFAALKWSKVMNMAYYRRHAIDFVWEEDWGMAYKAGLKMQEDRATGHLFYKKITDPEPFIGDDQGSIRYTEAYFQAIYSPGQSYINSKQQRKVTNYDAPVFKLKHTIGFKNVLRGQYNYNVTEASVYLRQWLKTWGKLEAYINAGIQWDQVPYPLLIAPAANLSMIWQRETFVLINNMEFLNDRYLSLKLEWDLNGKLFNRIPLLQHLQWREFVGFNILYGGLSEKNNPYLAENIGNSKLMEFPEGAHIMTGEPYMEFRVGIHNIFKLLQIEYVRRLNYLGLSTAHKHGVRFGFKLSF